MNEKIKILFILPSLKAGGAERVVSFIAQNLDSSLFSPVLLVVGFENDIAYSIKDIETYFLNKSRVLSGVTGIFSKINSIKPQIVMTSIEHLTAVTSIQKLWFRKIKFVAREANIKKVTKIYHITKMPFVVKTLYTIGYKLLDAIICQSKDMANELKELRPRASQKIHIINNPITVQFPSYLSNIENRIPKYITIGRLHDEKGHCRVLEALNLLDFDFSYTIIGTGPHENNIREKVEELQLNDKVIWIDYTNDVEMYLNNSSVFIQGSYAEGFPNALLESCAVGTPVIAYNCPGGTSEIIEHGVNGFLIDSEKDLKDKLMKLVKFPLDKNQIIASVTSKFSKEQIISQYESLFINLIK